MKMNFDHCEIQKWTLQTVRSGKEDAKNGSFHLSSFYVSFLSYGL